jgi:hypothetical protein
MQNGGRNCNVYCHVGGALPRPPVLVIVLVLVAVLVLRDVTT